MGSKSTANLDANRGDLVKDKSNPIEIVQMYMST